MSNPLASAEARQAAERFFERRSATLFPEDKNLLIDIIAESYADLVRANVKLRDERDNAYALVKVEDEHRQAAESLNRELVETLQTIADFVVGHGDVCELIAKRARAAINSATPKGSL